MGYSKKELEKLAKKVINGKATEAEALLLNEYYNSFEKESEIEDFMSSADKELLKEEILKSLRKHISSTQAVRSFNKQWFILIFGILIMTLLMVVYFLCS